MTKTLIPTIILLVLLFFITEEVVGTYVFQVVATSDKCISTKDCDPLNYMFVAPNMIIAACKGGFCVYMMRCYPKTMWGSGC
jgi:hypothetical protein